tara:strand:- start:414 stop:845 length:432 start_codon:yes stop_codon:yes gene_type:complete
MTQSTDGGAAGLSLGRRAVESTGWFFMPGMLLSDGISVAYRLLYCDGGKWWAWANYPDPHTNTVCVAPTHEAGLVPVFDDPPTTGALYYVVRSAFSPRGVHIEQGDPTAFDHVERRWGAFVDDGPSSFGRTLPRALVGLLEQA